jgi:hypothetical protein
MWVHFRLCFSLIAAAIMALMLTGCSGSASSSGGSGSIPQVQHVAVVVLENANFADVIGSANMPFLNSLVAKGALAGQYFANVHPSIGNYFFMTTGEEVTNDNNFTGVVNTNNVVRELTASGKSWKTYAESIPAPGYLGGDQGSYLRRHNPFSFFSDVQQSTSQAANIVPFTQFSTDLSGGNLPNYSFIVPNAQNDAHSCPDGTNTSCTLDSRLQRADQWMQSNIAPLLSDSSFQQSGLLIITFDESADDSTNGGGRIATVLVGNGVKAGYTGNTTSYDHRSLLSLTMKVLGVSNVPNGADSAPQMSEFFQ